MVLIRKLSQRLTATITTVLVLRVLSTTAITTNDHPLPRKNTRRLFVAKEKKEIFVWLKCLLCAR